MFVKMSLRDRLVCFAGFVGMNLLACRLPITLFLFLLPLPKYFLGVCLATFFAAVLKLFLPITTSAISGTANSNKSAPTRFAAGTIFFYFFTQKWNCRSLNNLCKCTESPSTFSTNPSIEWNLYFS